MITSFNNQLKQVLLLALLIALILISIREMHVFIPGLLGALTLYILTRGTYFQLVYHRKWKKGWTAGLFLIVFILLLIFFIYVVMVLIGPKIQKLSSDPSIIMSTLHDAVMQCKKHTGITIFQEDSLEKVLQKISDFLPTLINSTVDLLLNLAVMLFMLYYMLVHGKEMETYLSHIIPLGKNNIAELASETKTIVRASALGIPLISVIQGATATLGYFIFGPKEYVLWGFLTGVFAFFPVVGTMIIWVPLVALMYAIGDSWHATGLGIYSLIVTGNVDYLARITILEKIGHVHPVITVLGVIVGLGLFGFIGLIFGPLLVNYIILLFRIYSSEFLERNHEKN